MNAEIIAVGSELLTPYRTDTNSLYLTDQLNQLGVEVVLKSVVGDHLKRLVGAAQHALFRSEIVVFSGGLGPTEDDLTREAVSEALGIPLRRNEEVLAAIESRFAARGWKMSPNNVKQADILEGASVLPNANGTAPGQWVEQDGRLVILLPGPPGELKPLFEKQCMPRLAQRLPGQVIRTRFYRVAGMGESDLDALIAPVYSRYTNPATTVLAAQGDIQIHLRARASTAEEAEALLAEVGDPVASLLGERLYSRDGSPLEQVIGTLLRERQATLAVAESCTGGMIGERLTTVPGSSDYFVGGVVAYSDRIKTALLGVDAALIAKHTAVSEEVAIAMAEGVRNRAGARFAISTTGEAGPDSSTGAAVGTVFVGFAAEGCPPEARRYHMPGGRDRVRGFTTQAALEFLRRKILSG